MNFLAMIIAVLLDRMNGFASRLRHDGWFLHWQGVVAGLGARGWLQAALVILVPLFGAGLLLQLFAGILFGLPWIALACALLLYSFGRSDPGRLQAEYRSHCRRGDFQGAWLGLQATMEGQELELGQDAATTHASVQRVMLYQGYQRWFGVLFYFFLFGPLGALAYRLCHLLETEDTRARLLFWADWLPARALAATYCLAGDFTASVDALWASLRERSMAAPDVLQLVGFAAAGDRTPAAEFSGDDAARHNEEQEALMTRSAICWITLISFLVILG